MKQLQQTNLRSVISLVKLFEYCIDLERRTGCIGVPTLNAGQNSSLQVTIRKYPLRITALSELGMSQMLHE